MKSIRSLITWVRFFTEVGQNETFTGEPKSSVRMNLLSNDPCNT